MSNWTQPVCDNCWQKANPDRIPVRFRFPVMQTCCMCGESTLSGIYTRVDPKTVPYPREERDE